jgi:mono/diheme cytochrome c family protein
MMIKTWECSITKVLLFVFVITLVPISFALAAETTAKDEPGKKIFLDNKCNICHSIQAAGIAKKGPAMTSTPGKNAPPDLSGVGAERSADWITKFLKKEVDLNGKKHSKLWTGKPEDLTTLAKWLESLKTKPEKK